MRGAEAEMRWPGGGTHDERQLREVLAAARAFDPERVTAGVLSRIAPAAGDAVLEVGCGSGRALLPVAARVPRGVVVGVEPSDLLLRHAGRRTRPLVESGRVRLLRATSDDLGPLGNATIDKAFGVHVVPLWRDARADLRELRRVLRPGGRLVLAFRPADDTGGCARPGARYAVSRLEALLREAGFGEVGTERTREAGPILAWTVALR